MYKVWVIWKTGVGQKYHDAPSISWVSFQSNTTPADWFHLILYEVLLIGDISFCILWMNKTCRLFLLIETRLPLPHFKYPLLILKAHSKSQRCCVICYSSMQFYWFKLNLQSPHFHIFTFRIYTKTIY